MTPPSRRQQVATVLRRHGIYLREDGTVNCDLTNPDVTHLDPKLLYDTLLTELMLLVPPVPDREALVRIFARHDGRYPSAEAWKQVIQADLMQWIQGQPSTPVWCAHICWHSDGVPEEGSWRFLTPEALRGTGWSVVGESWDVCPLRGCHARRPTETS